MDIQKRVGVNLVRIRKEKGLSQERLAFECSIDRTYLSGIERGVRNPTISSLVNITTVLGIDIVALFEPL